jgi:hypothetical protein
MADKLKAGDRVLVQVGFDEVEARVLEVYGPNDSRLLLAVRSTDRKAKCSTRGPSASRCDEYCADSPLLDHNRPTRIPCTTSWTAHRRRNPLSSL